MCQRTWPMHFILFQAIEKGSRHLFLHCSQPVAQDHDDLAINCFNASWLVFWSRRPVSVWSKGLRYHVVGCAFFFFGAAPSSSFHETPTSIQISPVISLLKVAIILISHLELSLSHNRHHGWKSHWKLKMRLTKICWDGSLFRKGVFCSWASAELSIPVLEDVGAML